MARYLSGVTRTRILVIGLDLSEFLSQEKERRFSFESAGDSSRATCHSAKLIPPFTLTVSKANCFPVYRKLIMWSTIKCKRPWKLAIFRQKVFLTRLGLRFTYVNQACHFETNQVHVGGALGERHQINKGSLEIFACILLSNRMIRLCGKFYPCSFIPNWTWLFKFACNTDLNDNFRRQN